MSLTKSLSNTSSYTTLLEAVRSEIQAGRRAIEQQKALTYWKVGELISIHILENKDRAKYGAQLLEKLSKNLSINKRTLHQAVKFHETYPIVSARSQLGWSHYRKLVAVKDESKRKQLEARVIREGLTSRELQEEIKRVKLKHNHSKPFALGPLPVTRGRLYTYKVIEPVSSKNSRKYMLLDCGFNFWHEIAVEGGPQLKEGDIVEVIKKGDTFTIQESDRDKSEIFTFKAYIERIVDGDTIWVHIDLGFGNRARQKLRLKGIDTPEMDTSEGRKAKRFVEQALKSSEIIVIKTYGSDKYDRYLADIFYLPDILNGELIAQRGRLLNQELVDKNLAVKV